MALSRGTQLGSCEILDLLGAGGMGEVYRGRDKKLGRDVAVKALPDAFAQDHERMARFEREAQVLAALNHPNLATIHELKDFNGSKFLILELVEGETLGERIARGPIPVDEALNLATQIADALEAAHEKGIVHRDLKPANIKITPEGRVKVLDFGLAKIEPSNASQHLSNSPTLSAAQTANGVILGTAAYMSPEQARGKDVDRRTDVWAFGCVLYEMLTGRQAFPVGETVSDTIAGILVRDTDWQLLPAATPPKVRALLERCLRKDPRRRWGDIADVRVEIEEARSERSATTVAAALPAPSSRRGTLLAVLAAFFFLTAVGATVWLFSSSGPEELPLRLQVMQPPGSALGSIPDAEISPDGSKVAFQATFEGRRQIWVRPLNSTATALPGTESTGRPLDMFWSSDSQYLGFLADGKLKKVAASGGPPQVVSNLPAGRAAYTGSWSVNNVILLGAGRNQAGPLLRVSASGGTLTPATELDASRKETSHSLPHFLPDGRHFLYVAQGTDPQHTAAAYVGELDSKERRPLTGIASEVKYSSTGHVVFIRDNSLLAQPFDVKRLELTGDAFPVVDSFQTPGIDGPFSVSTAGALAYLAANALVGGASNTQLAWYDRKGQQLSLAGPAGEYSNPELSPDGKFVAFNRGAPADIWVLEIDKDLASRLTSDPGDDINPRWSPDGKRIAFQSNRNGVFDLYERAVGVVGQDKLLLKTGSAKTLSDWSHDGRYLIYNADNDVWAVAVGDTADAKPIQITQTPFNETFPRISPDGRWIIYISDEAGAGQLQVYVQSFPEPGFKQQVSTTDGTDARWSLDGKEIFLRSIDPGYQSVSVKPSGASLSISAPVFMHPRAFSTATFSISPDGRFLRQIAAAAATTQGGRGNTLRAPPHIIVLMNWVGRGKDR